MVSIVHRKQIPGTPGQYTQSELSVVREMVKEALDLIGGLDSVIQPGDRVLVKPNAGFLTSPEEGYTTDCRLVESIVSIIREETKAKEIIVVERAALGKRSRQAFEKNGIGMAALRGGANYVFPLEEGGTIDVKIPQGRALESIGLPKILFDSDILIYLPKMKTHIQAVITGAMKLSQGLLSWRDMIQCHRVDLHQKVVDLLRIVKPDLCVVDGIWAMQGQGPASPYEEDIIKDMNVIIAGKDAVAVDAVTASVMGFDPYEIPMIREATLEVLGLGNIKKIKIKGNQIHQVKRYFKRANCSLLGLHPKIKVYIGGACNACLGFIRNSLDWAVTDTKILEKIEEITIIVGYRVRIFTRLNHDPPRSYVFVVGDCTSEHKDKGIFLPGCPSVASCEIANLIGKSEEECTKKVKELTVE